MGDEEAASLDGQFNTFSRLYDNKRSGETINLWRSDYWMRQANILDDRRLTMTDTGIHFFKFEKVELTWDEWLEFISDLCRDKNLNEQTVQDALTNCGMPGQTVVVVPEYRSFFKHYKPVEKAIIYCNATHDGFLCWPPTPAGHTVFEMCPAARLSDTSHNPSDHEDTQGRSSTLYEIRGVREPQIPPVPSAESSGQAFRRCDSDGLWLGRRANESSPKGWTNYTPCFPTQVQKLLVKLNADENSQEKFDIAQNTRYLEIVGFTSSLIALLLSLFIFSYFKSLHNSRTNIHRNLFTAMTIQVMIRLIIYTDQAINRDQPGRSSQGLDGMPYLCQGSYILLEYAISCMFMWMFVEGLFLHSVVTGNALRVRSSSTLFLVIGWGLPLLLTIVWTVVTALYYTNDKVNGCWYGYNFLSEYWFLQGPRLAVILINLLFLLNIMKVLISKLNATETNEITKIKKAVRAALVLLPLLGITNILNMIDPDTGAVWKFALWCYLTHFLRAFQGFFIAIIYCFSNGEVNEVIAKTYRDRIEERRDTERNQRNASAERELHSRWWYICMETVLTCLRKARQWLRDLLLIPNTAQNADIAMTTMSVDMLAKNYADPYFQNVMEEVRLENNVIVIAEND